MPRPNGWYVVVQYDAVAGAFYPQRVVYVTTFRSTHEELDLVGPYPTRAQAGREMALLAEDYEESRGAALAEAF